ncbi:von Willebrand factor type A domain protein [Planctomycetes bacterium Poly30]|uniref:von Willebrand factor type A domain protein n=1 Tax=Saltatorellus ferox TaxID=2528018 RepID=A0A518EU68_9BACT|nr:von Willebrand factor type A domain protein [Planctomycetes bacterium Poly30]
MRPGLGLDLMKLGAALLGVAAVGAWFFRMPSEGTEDEAFTRPAVTALLIDTSASVTRARQGWKKWAIRAVEGEARAARARGDEVALITFDAEVERRVGPVDAETFIASLTPRWFDGKSRGSSELATELEGAARAAAALLAEEGRAPGSIVVIGDGVPTGADPSSVLLQDPDWTLGFIEPPPPDRVDLGVVRTIAPEEVAPGVTVPVELDCVLFGPAVSPGTRIFVDWEIQVTGTDSATRGRELFTEQGQVSGTVLAGTSEVVVPQAACGVVRGASARSFRARLSVPGLKEGSASFQARVRIDGVVSDPFPENDLSAARWIVGDPVRVVVCASEGSLRTAASYFTGPAFDGIEFRGVTPAQLGEALAVEPVELPDAVVSVEVPYASLPADALVGFVLERGGGWIHSAGWPLTSIDPSPLRAIAALEPDLTPKPPRDIVFFVDGSGSMEGERWQRMRDALRKLVPSVPSTDTLSLRFFTRKMGPEELRFPAQVDGGPEVAKERDDALKRLLRMRVPGGATDIVASLFELARARESREHHDPEGATGPLPDDGLVVLISDGETRSINERRQSARAKLAAGRDDFVAIHVGEGKGVTFLKGLLRKGEEVVVAGELEGLLDLLQEVIHDLSVVEEARLVVVDSVGDGRAADSEGLESEWWGPMVRGIEAALPSVDPIVIARALPGRPAEGANPLLQLASEALKLQGRTATFAAAAARGRGLTVGLAAPLVDEDADRAVGLPVSQWVPGLRARSDWIAPIFRTAARLRDVADEELSAGQNEREPTAAWVEDASRLLGAGAGDGGPVLHFEDLVPTLPLDLIAEFEIGPDPRGGAGGASGTRIKVPVRFNPGARDPRTERVVGAPDVLLDQPGGTEFRVSLVAPEPDGEVVAGPFLMGAPGSQEARWAGRDRVAPALLAAARGKDLDGGDRRQEETPFSGDDEQRGHPVLPWLLLAGLGSLFTGAAMACRGR